MQYGTTRTTRMRVSEPMNPYPGDTARTIKANYHKVSLDNFLRGGSFAATGVITIEEDVQEDGSGNS